MFIFTTVTLAELTRRPNRAGNVSQTLRRSAFCTVQLLFIKNLDFMMFLNVVDDVIEFLKLCDVMINIFNIMIVDSFYSFKKLMQ